MMEAVLWSALGLWAVKELYKILDARGVKADESLQQQAIRLKVLEEKYDSIKEDVAVLKRNEVSQWRAIDEAKKCRD